MNWLKPDKKLTDQLKASSADFKFDPNPGKYRLLSAIAHLDQKKTSFHFSHILKYSMITAVSFVLFLTGAFALAFNSQPGDKLFSLNKFGENIILNLPLTELQKAEVQEQIVTKRLEALDQVQAKSDSLQADLEARKLETIKESDETLTAAIDNISKNKQKLEASGNKRGAEKLNSVLERLQLKAADREKTIQKFEDETTNKDSKAKIREHLQKIKKSREKAQLEINRPWQTPQVKPIEHLETKLENTQSVEIK